MPLEQEIGDEIIAAFTKRATRDGTRPVGSCPLCGSLNDWTVGDGFVTVTVVDAPLKVTLGGESYPLIALVCRNCGNTMFLNLFVLELHDLIRRLNPDAVGPNVQPPSAPVSNA